MAARRKAQPAPKVAEAKVPTIGTTPPIVVGDQEALRRQWASKLVSALSKAHGSYVNNPMWNDSEELEIMASIGFAKRVDEHEARRILSFTNGAIPTGNQNINDRFSKRHTVADLNIPRNPEAMIQLSMRYALENPFVSSAAKVKTNFICAQWEHKTHNTTAKEFYDQKVIDLNLAVQLPKIVFNMLTIGLCPIYWGGEEGGPITFFQVVDPLACRYKEVLGKMKLWLKMTPDMIDAVKDPTGQKSPFNKVQFESMPAYWIKQIQEAVNKGRTDMLIELKDGSYTVCENRYVSTNRMGNTLDGVPLQAGFDALQRYRLLSAGDFAVAWNVKNMLTLISEGDPKDPNYTPGDDLRLMKLESQFANPDYALTIYCDPTTNVRYIVPPLEVFDPKKYMQVEKEIKEVMGLPSFMWANDGNSTFGAAVAEVIRLKKECEYIRMLLREQLFRPLYSRLRVGTRSGFKQSDIPLPTFDEASLQDIVSYLQHIGEMYARGACSLESYMELSGLNFEYEMAQKELEHEKYGNTAVGEDAVANNTPARPLYEPSQGNLKPNRDKGGNQADSDGNPADKKAQKAPRVRGQSN